MDESRFPQNRLSIEFLALPDKPYSHIILPSLN
jgi:hypothetical protein